jgi:3-oxoacyl-[acyl-carrier protein] reductase
MPSPVKLRFGVKHGHLTGKTGLVVGGSGGIGRAVALALGAEGAHLVIHGGHDERKLRQTADTIRRQGGTAEERLLPVSSSADYRLLLAGLSRVDVLVVAFGPFLQARLHDTTHEQWSRLIDLNLTLPGALVSAVLPGMRERGFGRIVLFGGTGTEVVKGYQTNGAYAAAKVGLGVLARSVARQYAGSNVSCNVICPGIVETEYQPPELMERVRRSMPNSTAIQPEEVAEVTICTVCTPSVALNGAILPVNKGHVP